MLAVLAGLAAAPAAAQIDYAAAMKQGDAMLRDFRFASGQELARAATSIMRRSARRGAMPPGAIVNAVMVLHGTGGSGRQFLQPQFARRAVRARPAARPQPLLHHPARRHRPRQSSKPSDGLRMRFPNYDYDDMVEAQRRMLVEGLGVTRLRLLMGTSMGCMHGFVWAEAHPDFVQAMMPMACLPVEIAGHNRMWRQRRDRGDPGSDPAWQGGNYTTQPVQGLRTAVSLLQVAGFAPLYLQSAYPDRESGRGLYRRADRHATSRPATPTT